LVDVLENRQPINPPYAPGARWGKFLKDVHGLQRLSWTTTWGNDAHFQLHSFENGLENPRLVWDIPYETMYSPLTVVTDIDGYEVLCIQETSQGYSRIVALGLDGSERWYYDFPEFNGRAPIWNETGTTIWALGHFSDTNRLDVLISNRRSIMHSDETIVINPRDKSIFWHRDILEVREPWTDTPWKHTRGYGGGLTFGWLFKGGRVVPAQSPVKIKADEWQHVAVSWDPAKFWNIYLNGEVLIEYPKQNDKLTPNTDPMLIGTEKDMKRFYSGVMDDWALFNKGLTQDEVKQIMAGIQNLLPVNETKAKLTSTWGRIKG